MMISGEPRYLLFRRSENVIYSGQWRMIGGNVKSGESAVDAAIREFREETSQDPESAWVLPTLNAFYNPKANQIRYIPTFAFECGTDQMQLNHEHDLYDWFNISDALLHLR